MKGPRRSIAVIAVGLSAGVLGAMPASAANLVRSLDWETPAQQTVPGAPPEGWAAEYKTDLVHPDSGEPQLRIAHAPEPVRGGSAAARFELHKNDPVINNGARAELTVPFEPKGAERWYGFSLYLPADWDKDQSAEILTQWHQHWDIGGSPPLALQTRNGNWEISQHWEDHESHTVVDEYQRGRWTDWVFHVKWSSGDDGQVQIWKDGRPVPGFEDKRGKNTYNDPVNGNYMKIGIYKWAWSQDKPSDTTRRVMYHDELCIADETGDYGIVAPRVEPCGSRPFVGGLSMNF